LSVFKEPSRVVSCRLSTCGESGRRKGSEEELWGRRGDFESAS
jgi:hypothetical protein